MTALARVAFEPDKALAFWPTPPDVAEDLVYGCMEPWLIAGLGEGIRVLEPSAGDGHLARAIREHLPKAHITCVEPSPARAANLRGTPDVADDVIESTIEDYLTTRTGLFGEGYDLIIANPPFALPGRPEAWAEQLLALRAHALAPHGHMGAVVPRIVLTGKSRLVRAVRDAQYHMEACDRGAFKSVGAGVATALVWMEAAT